MRQWSNKFNIEIWASQPTGPVASFFTVIPAVKLTVLALLAENNELKKRIADYEKTTDHSYKTIQYEDLYQEF